MKTTAPRSARAVSAGSVTLAFTPRSNKASKVTVLRSSSKKFVIALLIRGPTPGIASRSSRLADLISEKSPKWAASWRATLTPTSGIPSATRKRLSSGVFFAWIAETSPVADFSANPSSCTNCSAVMSNSWANPETSPVSTSTCAVSSPNPSI